MPDYIINQSCDENRVVDAVRVGQAQRYGKLIELKPGGGTAIYGLNGYVPL